LLSSYGVLTFTPVGLDCSPTEHASIRWTHFRTAGFPQYGFKTDISGRCLPVCRLLPACATLQTPVCRWCTQNSELPRFEPSSVRFEPNSYMSTDIQMFSTL